MFPERSAVFPIGSVRRRGRLLAPRVASLLRAGAGRPRACRPVGRRTCAGPCPSGSRRTSGNRSPGSSCTSKISSTAVWNSSSATTRPSAQVHRRDAALQLAPAARPAARRPSPRSAGSWTGRRRRTARTAPGPRAKPGSSATASTRPVAGSTSTQPPGPRLQQPEPAVVPARRVRHRQAAGHDLAAGHVDQAAAAGLVRPPAAGGVGLAQGGDVPGPAVHQGQAVEVAAVLGGQGGDERRPPPGHEAVVGVQRTQAGEPGVDRPTAPRPPRRVRGRRCRR